MHLLSYDKAAENPKTYPKTNGGIKDHIEKLGDGVDYA
jgi:hypothetical protein